MALNDHVDVDGGEYPVQRLRDSKYHYFLFILKDLSVPEVQSFCVAFSRVREAATLFKLLKSMEST